MRHAWLSLALLATALGACDEGDGPPPSVMDQPPEEAAEVSTEVVCDYVERCGRISVTCADCSGDGGDCPGCTVESIAVTYAQCESEVHPDLVDGFGCETLTAEEEARIDECLAALPDLACPSVEVVEDWANGGGGDDPRTPPAACDVLEDVRYRCQSDQNVGMSSTPIPD